MSSIDGFADAFESVRASHRAGRLAHAFLISGSPRGEGLAFAEAMIRLVLGDEDVDVHLHPDVSWVEPEKKSRVISIEQVRDNNKLVAQKSYAGGWKSVVFLHADRINDAAANALLKTLEEPSPRTLLLLVTDAPQGLLATIASRCQRITLSSGLSVPQGDWLEPLLSILRSSSGGPLESLAQAARIKALLDAERKRLASAEAAADIEGEDEELGKNVWEARVEAKVRQMRADVLQVMALWRRDLLLVAQGSDPSLLMFPGERTLLVKQASHLSLPMALAGQQAIQDAARRLDRNVHELMVFESFALATSGGASR